MIGGSRESSGTRRPAHWSAPTEEIRIGLRRSDNTIRVHAEHDGLSDYILVVGDGYACKDDTADFTVDRVEYNADGWTDVFQASITHTCGNLPMNAFRARVDFNR